MADTPPPIITLSSDFGSDDWYVAAMKAVLMRLAPNSRLVDVTHGISHGDFVHASICIERTLVSFEPGTIHLAVVDPGVGSERRILILRMAGQTVICPDNGLITWAWHRLPGPHRVYELTWRPENASSTFHGRDIFAPAAAMLATGKPLPEIAKPIRDPQLLDDLKPAEPPLRQVRCIHIDHFGNVITNALEETWTWVKASNIKIGRDSIPLHRTYTDVPIGHPLAVVGSSGLVELAIRNGSAASYFGIQVGMEIKVERLGRSPNQPPA